MQLGSAASWASCLYLASLAAWPPAYASDQQTEKKFELSAILGATSDYVYRGVSQRSGDPTPLAYVLASYGIFYAEGFLVGVDLGDDALGRGIGTIEADATVGIKPRIRNLELNLGVKYTGYPNGRDLVFGTLIEAERDFIEPFAGATLALTDAVSLGATVYWTPDFYYETDAVTTLEGKFGLVLPVTGGWAAKLTGFAGWVKSERDNVVAPGDNYTYFNIGIEAQVERMLFDVRYWTTDVEGYEAFDQRLAVSAGVAF